MVLYEVVKACHWGFRKCQALLVRSYVHEDGVQDSDEPERLKIDPNPFGYVGLKIDQAKLAEHVKCLESITPAPTTYMTTTTTTTSTTGVAPSCESNSAYSRKPSTRQNSQVRYTSLDDDGDFSGRHRNFHSAGTQDDDRDINSEDDDVFGVRASESGSARFEECVAESLRSKLSSSSQSEVHARIAKTPPVLSSRENLIQQLPRPVHIERPKLPPTASSNQSADRRRSVSDSRQPLYPSSTSSSSTSPSSVDYARNGHRRHTSTHESTSTMTLSQQLYLAASATAAAQSSILRGPPSGRSRPVNNLATNGSLPGVQHLRSSSWHCPPAVAYSHSPVASIRSPLTDWQRPHNSGRHSHSTSPARQCFSSYGMLANPAEVVQTVKLSPAYQNYRKHYPKGHEAAIETPRSIAIDTKVPGLRDPGLNPEVVLSWARTIESKARGLEILGLLRQ